MAEGRLERKEVPLLGAGAVDVPNVDVGAVGGAGIVGVESMVAVAGGKEGVAAVVVGLDVPEFGATVVGGPETDVIAIGSIRIGKVNAVTVGVSDSVGVGGSVIGKGPDLGGSAVGFVELDIGAWGRVVVVKVDGFAAVILGDNRVGTVEVRGGGSKVRGRDGARATSNLMEEPALGEGVVGVPDLDVSAVGGFAIGAINDAFR